MIGLRRGSCFGADFISVQVLAEFAYPLVNFATTSRSVSSFVVVSSFVSSFVVFSLSTPGYSQVRCAEAEDHGP